MSTSRLKNPLKVACVGTGYFSQFHYEAWHSIHAVQLTAVCNRTLKAAQDTANTFNIPHHFDNFETMLSTTKPDIVDIITPPQTHLEYLTIAAQYGVDVICQKPFGENIEQAKAMVDIAENAGIRLIIHENFRFMPWYRVIKKQLDRQLLGDILNVTFKLRPGDGQGKDAYLQRQPYFQTMEKFLVHETAIHFVDTFQYLFGEIESVYADLRRCNPVIAGEDAGMIIFDTVSAGCVVFDGNRLLDHASDNTRRTMGELCIEGTQGTLRLDGQATLWLRAFGKTIETEIDYPWLDKNFGGNCVFNLIEHVVKHYSHGTPLENTGKEYLRNLIIENAIYTSNSQHQRINISHEIA